MTCHTPLVSIIVPAYNSDMFIGECLDSISAQTHTAIDVIVVDDGSDDSTGSIASAHAAVDDRFSVLHIDHAGAGTARNAGLDKARGEWIAFIDSDDVVHPRYIETMLHMALDAKADIAAVCHTRHRQKLGQTNGRILEFSGCEALADMLYQSHLDSSPCCKLYHSSCFDDIRFNVDIIFEDLEMLSRLLPKTSSVVWKQAKLYYYRRHAGSTLANAGRKRADAVVVTSRIIERVACHRQRELLLPAARDRCLSACFNLFYHASRNSFLGSEDFRRLWENIRRLRVGELSNSRVRLKNKVGVLLSYVGRRLFITLSRVLPC